VAAHALGYVREVDQQDIERDNYYKQGDFIGKRGLEAYYEKYLRGKKGVRRWLVTSTGRIVEPYQGGKTDTMPQAGLPLTISLDLELQKYAEFLMKDKPGALVAIEPKTGEILAYVSSPFYDPNLLTGKNLPENYRKLENDRLLSPLYNRPIQSYKNPPGSTFKVVKALVALQEGIINDKTVFYCPGGYYYQGISIKCHMHRTPYVDFYYSIQASCNTYYCNVYQRIINNPRYKNQHQAYQAWYEYVRQFGLGAPLGIDIPGEMPGTLLDTIILDAVFRRYWTFHDVVHMAIGQGRLGITPLQLANVAATIANRGYYITPHFGIKIGDSVLTYDTHYVQIDTVYFNKVVKAMSLVFEPGGTAAFSKIPGLTACGKTGTAQNPPASGKDDNSIFIAFAPKDNPKIAVAVYVEEGGPGSQTAAPIASLLIQKYLLDSIVRPDLYIARVKDKNIIQKILQRENAKKRSTNIP
jgi:penicillin-binding protein 2